MCELIHEESREVIVQAFVDGANLRPKGVQTYFCNCKRRMKTGSTSPFGTTRIRLRAVSVWRLGSVLPFFTGWLFLRSRALHLTAFRLADTAKSGETGY